MLKDIYFPYIQNGMALMTCSDKRSSRIGGEVVATNLAAYKWSAIYSGASLKESVDTILEKAEQDCVEAMDKEVTGLRRKPRRSYSRRSQLLVAQGRATSKCYGTIGVGSCSHRKSCYIGTGKSKKNSIRAAEKRELNHCT